MRSVPLPICNNIIFDIDDEIPHQLIEETLAKLELPFFVRTVFFAGLGGSDVSIHFYKERPAVPSFCQATLKEITSREQSLQIEDFVKLAKMQPSQHLKALMPEGWWRLYTYDNGKTELWRNFELKLAYHKNSEKGFWMIDREYGIEDIPELERMISKIKEHGKITMVFGNNFEFRKHGGEI